MNLTKAQGDAIAARDLSLIISAGAGSGKTAVLTQRILERICDENDDCNISDFLIVTFTNAAAKELSDRMRKKLTEKAGECPGNRKIAENLALLPLAKISTINSFCYEVVRTNFQKLGLSASVRIGDEAEMNVIRNKLMNEVVDDAFESMGNDGDFLTAYEIFSSAKNDGGFVDTLLNLHRLLTNIPDIEVFKNDVLDRYTECAGCEEYFDTFYGKQLKSMTAKLFEKNMKSFESLMRMCSTDEALSAKYLPVLDAEYEFSRLALHTLELGYDKTKQLLDGYKPKSLVAVKNTENPSLKENIKNAKNSICGDVKEHISDFYCCDGVLLRAAAEDTWRVLKMLFSLVEDFDARLTKLKKRRGIIEFSDAERYTLKLLVESTEPFRVTKLAESLRERFKEIYIDEYQDVNPLQDLIFKALARVDGDYNEYTRFMVGDVKQSIYRFRGASPSIFLGYRDSFKDIDSLDGVKQRRIFMNHNFRCSKSVVDFSNYLFRKLMGSYYLEGDELVFARHEEIPVAHKAQLLITQFDKETAIPGVSSDMLEAAVICDKIKEIVDNPAYRDSNGKTYSYKDIAVLARSKAALKTFEGIFSEKGIPVVSDVGESFYGKKEIKLCLNILESIDNPMRDIPLAGYMRSFCGRFTDDELCMIKDSFRSMKLYNSVKHYAENDGGKCDAALCDKCRRFIDKLHLLREFSRGKSAAQLLWKIYTDYGILSICVSDSFTNDSAGTRRNLLKLYEMALDFGKTSFRGVGAFIDYVNSSMEKDDIKAERVVGSECVRLMTTHASKGLEFPVCFVSDLSRRFNKSDEKQYLVFEGNTGLACMLCDTPAVISTDSESNTVRISTPYKKLIASAIDSAGMEEEIRILYVALTRARDMLFMTGVSTRKMEKLIEEASTGAFLGEYSSSSSFLSLILSCIINDKAALPLYLAAGMENGVLADELSHCFECEYVSCEDACAMLEDGTSRAADHDTDGASLQVDEEYLEEITRLGSFSYGGDTASPAKLTVSMLKKGLIDDEMSDLTEADETTEEKALAEVTQYEDISLENRVQKKIPDFLLGEHEPDGAEIGTAMHMFMQFADYSRCESREGCIEEANRLCLKGFITQRQAELLEFDKLCRFFESDFYMAVKASGEIYREQRFNLEVSAFAGAADGSDNRDILVQGVIDLFFRNSDGSYTVVDFKTDRVFGAHAEQTLIDRHKVQLSYYCRAVSEMTCCRVRDAYLYSFALSKAVRVDI